MDTTEGMPLNLWSAGLFDRVFPGADKHGRFRKQVLSSNSQIALPLYRMLYDSRFRPPFTVEEMTTITLLRSQNCELTMPQIVEIFRRLPYVYRVLHQGTVAGKADISNTLREFQQHLNDMKRSPEVESLLAFGHQDASDVEMIDADGASGSDAGHWHEQVEGGIEQPGESQATAFVQDSLVVSAKDTWILFAGKEDAVFEDWYLHDAELKEPTPLPSPIGRLPEELILEILKDVLRMPSSVRIRAVPQPGICSRGVTQPCKFLMQRDDLPWPTPVEDHWRPLLANKYWNRLGKEAFYTMNAFEMPDHHHSSAPCNGLFLAARWLELMGRTRVVEDTPRYGLPPLLHLRSLRIEDRGAYQPEKWVGWHERFMNAVITIPFLKLFHVE